MNRRIGRLIQIGLFAALPAGWSASALAQSTAGSAVSSDTGINPLPRDNSSSLTKDQKKAGDIDQNLGNPTGTEHPGSLGVGDRSDTMGTSGSSGSTVGDKSDQSGSQMSGSSGAVPGKVDTNDIQRSSGQDKATDIDRDTQLKDDTSLDLKSEKTTTTKKTRSGRTSKPARPSTTDDTTDFGSQRKMNDTGSTPSDSTDITK